MNKAKVNGPAGLAADQLHTYFQGDEATLVIDPTMADDAYNISGNTITAKNEIGLLYGAYALLRGEQGYILNHWDNLNGTIERGYAGLSIFWKGKPSGKTIHGHQIFVEDPDQPIDAALIKKYAAANASIGINGTVLNNVNASPKMLSLTYIKKVKEYADLLRPYGIRVYLSVNFASPMSVPYEGCQRWKGTEDCRPAESCSEGLVES